MLERIISVYQSEWGPVVLVDEIVDGKFVGGKTYHPGAGSLRRLALVVFGLHATIRPFMAGVGYVARISGKE